MVLVQSFTVRLLSLVFTDGESFPNKFARKCSLDGRGKDLSNLLGLLPSVSATIAGDQNQVEKPNPVKQSKPPAVLRSLKGFTGPGRRETLGETPYRR